MVTTAKMGNRGGVLHGGMTATIFDILTTLPLMLIARDGFWQMLGVSRDLMVTYIRPVLEGEEIEVTAELVAVGKKLGKSTLRTAGGSSSRTGWLTGSTACACSVHQGNYDQGQ